MGECVGRRHSFHDLALLMRRKRLGTLVGWERAHRDEGEVEVRGGSATRGAPQTTHLESTPA